MRHSLASAVTLTTLFASIMIHPAMVNAAPITAQAVITNPSAVTSTNGFTTNVTNGKKTVYLMSIPLTQQQKQMLNQYKPTQQKSLFNTNNTALPSHIDLGMNNVPVLDQGAHGSCVTFANTGAIDALLGKGDYISQLCNLELGSYLEEQAYYPSGWDGSFSSIVLTQILQFGIVNKEKQTTQSCANVKEYPKNDPSNTGHPISVNDYRKLSENLNDRMVFEPLFDMAQRFGVAPYDEYNDAIAEKLLIKLKTVLASTSEETNTATRITFATELPVTHCSVGACARYHAANDTWALTKEINDDVNPALGGHEMIITGYDDHATAIDADAKQHVGLLILRNSWGAEVGDHGNYYMTYDFFKKYVMELQEIVKLND